MKPMLTKYVYHFLVILIGIIWITASYYKIINPVEFYRNILEYKLINGNLAAWVAIWFPFFELFLGIALIFHFKPREFLMISMMVFAFFAIIILIAIMRGLHIGCGCFSTNDSESISWALFRDVIFIILNYLALHFAENVKSV